MLLLLASTAMAATVAVLPLDLAAGGQAYDGLGTALAGMLTTDLSTAPGITLVERSRLDALLAEIDLSKTGFLDEASAQQLGKGLGAELVVLGSYSVVGEQFLLDARLVGVENATVVKASRANGTLSAFVDVEKELVTGLLDGLDIKLAEEARKKLLAAAPTQDFDAFAAYSSGVARQEAGEILAAQEAFGIALQEDPTFAEAKTALGSLRLSLDKLQADAARGKRAARMAVLDSVINRFGEPKDEKDTAAVPGFALRLMALDEEGRHCQRYEELRRYLETTGGDFSRDEKGWRKLVDQMMKLAVEAGMSPAEAADPPGHRDVEFAVQTKGAPLFSSPLKMLYGFPTTLVNVPSSADLLATGARCLTAPEQVAALGELRSFVDAHGLAELSSPATGLQLSLGERLEWSAIAVRARSTGIDAPMQERLQALLDSHEGEEKAFVMGEVAQILQMGEQVERARVAWLGFRAGEIKGLLEALGAQDPARIEVEAPLCAAVLPTYAPQAANLGRVLSRTAVELNYAPWVAPFRDLGCVTGVPARFASIDEAWSFVATSPSRARPENAARCRNAFEALPARLQPTPAFVPKEADAVSLLQWYYGDLVKPLCVSPE